MIVLGSTGSIGVNTLAIAKRFNLSVEGLCAGRNVELLNEQIKEFNPSYVVIGEESLREKVNHSHVLVGSDGIMEMLDLSNSELVVNALVGFFGLRPTIWAIEQGKRVALANKESLVAAGKFIDTSKIVPIDSEHFGLWYLLSNRPVERLIVTASGGAFRDTPIEKLPFMSPSEALKHPNWSMGRKITIDSATMTNKLFELLEAKWLFSCNKLDAFIETKSIIHALIDFKDGSTTAHIAGTDMKLPIAFALMGEVREEVLPKIDLTKVGNLEFREIEEARYPIWEIKDEILAKPELGAILNAANEVAMDKFFEGKINILELPKITKKAVRRFENINPSSVDEVFEIDKMVREYCQKL